MGIQFSPPKSKNEEKNLAFNKGRTYDHLHDNQFLGMPQYSDEEIAHMTRMLMRNDMWHEGLVTTARDRILCLLKEKTSLQLQVKELQAGK